MTNQLPQHNEADETPPASAAASAPAPALHHPAPAPRSPATVTDAEIYDRVISAILDHRLLPGTKLVEDKLAGAFGVSRTRIRPVLVRLANENVVIMRPNRGAVVAEPSPAEAHEVFEARRLIEPTLVQAYMADATDDDIAQLGQLIRQEDEARLQGDMRRAIRLSGDFHLAIAEGSGNQTLGRILRELVSRTSLILMAYGPVAATSSRAACGCMEHQALLDAMRLRAVPEAMRLMREHLSRIEADLVFEHQPPAKEELAELLGL